MMHNQNAIRMINDCNNEMDRIEHLIEGIGSTSPASGFLTKYALMKMSGTLERVYKIIIADYYKSFSSELEHFIDTNVLDVNLNASYQNICKLLKSFDEDRLNTFKISVRSLSDGEQCISLFNELNDIRNNVVHGGTIIPSFVDLRTKYEASVKIINVLDGIMCFT